MRTHGLMAIMGLLLMLALSIPAAQPAAAAPAERWFRQGCLPHKTIVSWHSPAQLASKGFNVEVIGDQASIAYGRYLSLDVAADPTSAQYTASRITEIDSHLPIAQRVKCWQPTAYKDVVVTFVVRFDQAAAPTGMTENLILWNAPLPFFDGTNPPTEAPIPVTTFGVSRQQGVYLAAVAQDLDLTTFSGTLVQQPMPAWLDPSRWHRVQIRVSQDRAQIAVAQGAQRLTPVLDVPLPRPPDPVGFQFSVDNEAFPGFYVPVTVPDGLDVAFLDMRYVRAR